MDLAPRLDIVTVAQMRALADRVAAEGAMRARCMVVPVDPITAICRVLGRYKMYVDLRDTGFVPHLMFEGYWEYWITDFIWRNVQPGQIALDLGANHGYYTILLADLVGADGKVHAFEPNPRLAELLEQTVAVNGFWHIAQVHAAAVGDIDGALQPFLVSLRDPKNGHMIQPGQPVPTGLDAARYATHQVPVVTLDEAVPGRADFLKIDVEGGEEAVWRGMQRLIERSPGIGIVMEFNPGRCRDPRSVLRDMGRRFPLREIGFDGLAAACTPEQVLERREDTILYLSEGDPA
jgi:FkbM family methyltransferase